VSDSESAVWLGLLDGFELRRGRAVVPLALNAQRVIAFLALHRRPLQRLYVSGNLWLESSQEHANASLRTTLWRIQRPRRGLIEVTSQKIALSSTVAVDVWDVAARAHRALAHDPEPGDLTALCAVGDLLPDWYDDWVMIERERFRQLRLHALESLCEQCARDGRFGEATEAGLAAVASEPLRESAHRAVIASYLAEHNAADAVRQYRLYRELVKEQLGMEPSARIQELVRNLPVGDTPGHHGCPIGVTGS
jgi:DNA-binding SARP family transcriptional activator